MLERNIQTLKNLFFNLEEFSLECLGFWGKVATLAPESGYARIPAPLALSRTSLTNEREGVLA